MPTWTLWVTVGVPVLVLVGGFAVRNYRNNNDRMDKRMDDVGKSHIKLLGSCRGEFASRSEFVDFRKETRISFDKLDKKIDDLPVKVKNLLDGGN